MCSYSHRINTPGTLNLVSFYAGKVKTRQAGVLIPYEKEHFLTLIWYWRLKKNKQTTNKKKEWGEI